MRQIPLLIIPFIVFNVGIVGILGSAGNPWADQLFSIHMISGGIWTMSLGDAVVLLGLVLLFAEIMKSTRATNASIVDHLLSILLFVAFLVEFILVPRAAHPVFFTLMIISLIDVLAGFSVSIRSAARDINVD